MGFSELETARCVRAREHGEDIGSLCGGLSCAQVLVLIEPFPCAHQQQVLPGDFSLPGGRGCDATGRLPRLAPETLSWAWGAQNPARAQLVFSLCRCICTSDLSALVLSTCCLSSLLLNFIFHRVSGPSLQDCASGAHPPGAAGRRSVFLLPKAALFLSWALCVRCDPGKLL